MLAITTTSERTCRWPKMHRPVVPFSVKESSAQTRSLVACITTTFGFRFSVHTRAACELKSTPYIGHLAFRHGELGEHFRSVGIRKGLITTTSYSDIDQRHHLI